jgi:NitT/TauT family transport system substrate-binding protein
LTPSPASSWRARSYGPAGVRQVAVALIVLAATLATAVGAPAQPLETGRIRVGLVVPTPVFLPLYLAATRTAREEGLQIELVTLQGSTGAAQALASGSIDVAIAALHVVVNMIKGGVPARAFYGGLHGADAAWFARPEIQSWAGVRGRRVGITSRGGSFESLTRYALARHGIATERDTQLVTVGGGSVALFQALRAGVIDVALMGPPFKWQAEERGFTRLGTEAQEVGEWPKSLFIARDAFLDANPATIRALLRAHVRAIRLAKASPDVAVATLQEQLRYERPDASRAYAEVMAGVREQGALSAESLRVFWAMAIADGDVTEPWPESRFFDRRFVDTFEAWAPR